MFVGRSIKELTYLHHVMDKLPSFAASPLAAAAGLLCLGTPLPSSSDGVHGSGRPCVYGELYLRQALPVATAPAAAAAAAADTAANARSRPRCVESAAECRVFTESDKTRCSQVCVRACVRASWSSLTVAVVQLMHTHTHTHTQCRCLTSSR